MCHGNSQPLGLIKDGISWEGRRERAEFVFLKTLSRKPVSDTVRAEDLQSGSRAKVNKEIGHAISRGKFS